MPKKILLVGNSAEDDWAAMLRDALISVGQLDSVSEHETSLHIQQKHYDLIIIDAATINDVENLVTTLHQQKPNIPIIVVTTSPTWQRARRVLLAGAADYIRKSLDPEKLLTIFQAILAKSVSSD